MKNNQYTATPNWFDKVQQTDDSVSTGNTYVTNFGSILLLSGLTDLVIEITGEEDGNGLSPEVSWNKEESKLSFVKTKFLKEGDPVVDADYVTTIADNPQDILSNKDFINGLSINKHRFFEKDGILYLDGNLALTGGLVIYADNPEGGGDPGPGFGGGTILDISITGEGNVLSDVSLSEDKTILQFVKTNIEFSGNYVDFTSDQDISGVKNFTNGIKLNGNRLYNDNGVIYLEGDLAVTGGITTFATAGRKVSTIMDGVVADEVTITVAEKDGVKQLSLKEGVGGGLTSAIITGTGNAVTDVTLEDEGKTLNLIKDKTFLIPSDLLGYAKEDWVTNQLLNYVTLNTEQDITTIKNFLEGITIGSSKKKFYEKDGVLYIDSDVAFTGGITTYATDGVTVSTIMDGIATDEVTITKGEDNVLRIKNAGSGSDFDATKMWKALAEEDNTKQINKSHLTTALKDYATITELNKKWTLDDEKIANWDDAYDKRHTHSNKTVLDGITAAKVTNWDTAFSWGNHATFGYAHLANEETFTGLKHFTEGLSVGSNKKKIYEKDGVVYLDGDLAVTGGITQFASGNVDISTIMDGVVVDGTTIKKENGKLVAIGGGQADSVEWEDILNKPASFTPSSHTHTKSQISDFPSSLKNPNSLTISLNGASQGAYDGSAAKSINITASSVGAYTKSESDNKYPLKSGSGASGNWGINITGNAASSSKLQTARTIWGQSFDGTNNVSGNMSNVGLINESIRIEGGYDNAKIRPNGHGIVFGGGNGYAHCTYAFRPEWGSQSETQCNVKIQNASAASSNPSYTTTHEFTSDGTAYHRTRVRVDRTDGEGSGIYTNTIYASDWFRSEGNTGWYSETYGGGWYMTDYNLIRAYNNKTIYTGGGLQTQGDIEIKGSGVFTTSNNTILRKKGYTNTDILRWDWNGTDGDHLKFTIPGSNDQSKYMKLSSGNGLVVTARIEGNNFNAKSNVSTYFSAYNSINEAISGSDPDYKWTWYHAKSGDVQRGFTLWSYSYAGAANQVAAFISYGGNQFKMFGNILATGGITQYSDIRAKNIIEDVNIDLQQIANSPTIRFKWNGYKDRKDDSKTHVGGIAQYIQNILPEVIYNTDDVLTMDYATTGYIFAVQTAKHLLSYESKTDKEINKLKKRIKYLEKQLKKLGYEEANVVDN